MVIPALAMPNGRIEAASKECGNTLRGLTHSLDFTKEGLAMNATRTSKKPTRVILQVGARFGRWTVVSEDLTRESWGARTYTCRCDCGRQRSVRATTLKSGRSGSCGCTSGDARVTHGMSKTPLYMVWRGMRDRTENQHHSDYENYGGRGIRVCPRWKKFTQFALDMAPQYRPGLQLDRIDNDGPYAPDNCRWVTSSKNNRNKRTNHNVTWHGETLTVQDWAERIGIKPNTLIYRLRRGWSVERALATGAACAVLELANGRTQQ